VERTRIALMGCLFSLLWASAFVAGKAALRHTDPISLLCARFAVAGALMLAWACCTRPRARWRDPLLWRDGLALGIFNNALYLGLSFMGLRTVSPEATVLIVSTAPFFAMALAAIGGTRCSWRQMAGVIVGFGGVYVVLAARIQGGADLHGALLVLLGTLSFAIGTVWYRHRAAQHDPLMLNALQNLAGALVIAPFAPHWAQALAALQQPDYLFAFAHLVLMVSIADFLLWLALLRRIGVAQASSFHLLNPLFGIALSALLLGAQIRGSDVVGALVVIGGLALAGSEKGAGRQWGMTRRP